MATFLLSTSAGDLSFLKRLNRNAILEMIRRNPGVTRADIASQAQLTKASVGSMAQELLDKGWLSEGALQRNGSGRPGRSLYLNDTRHVLLGAEVGVHGLRLIACTLLGGVIAQNNVEVPPTTPEATAQLLAKQLRTMLAHPEIRQRQCLGLGVAVPGPISPRHAILRLAPNLGWRDIEFLELLRPHLPDLGGLWLLENEAKAAAFGEFYFHDDAPPETLVYISAGTGIGAGLVGGGHAPNVYRGMHGLMGEIGHTILQPGGLYCHCGNRGCAETLVSGWAIRAALGIAEDNSLAEAIRLRLNEPEVQLTLRRAGEALGILMLNLHHTFNPPELVIGGSLTRLGPPLLEPALDYFDAHQHSLLGDDQPVKVRVIDDSTYTAARGAAAQVLTNAMREP